MTRAEFPKAYDGVLDLAIRYQAEDLKSVVVASLKDDWPSALTHWDMREATIRTEMKGSDGSPNSFYPNPVDAIQMAMEHKIYDILPVAFYDLSRLYHIEKLSPEEYGKPRTYNLGSWPLELRIIQGVVAIQERTSARFVDSDLRRLATCERPPTDTSCQMRIDQFLGGPVRRAARISFDPIGWINQATAFSGGLEACRTCRAACAKGMQDIRRELWMQLPDCFELTV
ncbi:hypothetical protein OF83DRAFT_1247025 [Amylostereum chailletii]|nr:hypothetical protein OF83DRAFT_1247025 [Amylostereum chailletii]